MKSTAVPGPPRGGARRPSWAWPIALIVTLTVFSAVGRPDLPPGPEFIQVDKVAHFLYFGLLATLVCRATRSPKPGVTGFAVAVGYGLGDEFVQALNPYRYADAKDLVFDALGAFVAVLAYRRWALYRRVLETPLPYRP